MVQLDLLMLCLLKEPMRVILTARVLLKMTLLNNLKLKPNGTLDDSLLKEIESEDAETVQNVESNKSKKAFA